jgi:hypothetical protein
LSAAARRAGPVRQRATAAWPPRTTLTAAPHSAPPRPDHRPAFRTAVPTASPTPPRPDRRLADRAAIPTAHQCCTAVRHSCASEPLPLSRFPRTGAASSSARRAAPPRAPLRPRPSWAASAAHVGRARCAGRGRGPRGHGPCWRCALCIWAERFQSSCIRLNFINF